MSETASPTRKDLAVKESILGVLTAKDKTGSGSVPISEFDKVVNAFGLSWDNPAVKNVLDHCRMESGDRMNFTALKHEIAAEKKRLTAKPVMKAKSPVVVATPKVSGLLKEQQAYMRERQQRAVQEQVTHINTVYKMLSNHEITKNIAVNLLGQHQIYPTKELLKVAADMELGEVSFAEFNRALTASDPFPRASAIVQAQTSSQLAGATKPKAVDKFVTEEATPGRKLYDSPPSQVACLGDEVLEPEPIKFTRKMAEDARGKDCIMGALFNETGDSILGRPEEVDWAASPAGRRHHIKDGSRNARLARAQLDHGDCVSWSQYETELEAYHAATAKPEGRKVDEGMVWANHLTNVISWDNFKGQNDISTDEVIRRELSMTGGLSVASGQRNACSSKNILAWDEDTSPKRRPAGWKDPAAGVVPAGAAMLNAGEYTRRTPPNVVTSSSSSPYEDAQQQWAGSPSLRPERAQLRKVSSGRNFSSPSTPPFGTDAQLSPDRSNSSLFGRGRTSSGARFGPEDGKRSPTVFEFVPAGSPTKRYF